MEHQKGLYIQCQWFSHLLSGWWFGPREPVKWSLHFPDFTSLDVFIWDHLKSMVEKKEVKDKTIPVTGHGGP
jgi:hypothetical protein